MNLERMEVSAFRFAAFVGEIVSVIGHVDRERPLNDYCAGLMVTEGRRSVEPIAAVTAPREVPAQHRRFCILLPMRRGRTQQCWPKCAN